MIIRKEVIVTLSFLREATDLVAQYKSKLMAWLSGGAQILQMGFLTIPEMAKGRYSLEILASLHHETMCSNGPQVT